MYDPTAEELEAILRRRNGGQTPATITAAELMERQFDPLKWCVPDILPAGTYLLSARPKVGKSWLALQIALAVATEGLTLGKRVQGGSALVLALEDNKRRLKSRLQKLGAFLFPNEDHLARLHLETDWPRVDQGGADAIEQWLIAHPDARLIVVDTLAKFRPPTGGRASAYEQDYQAMAPFMAMSGRYNLTVLVVHHNRKMDSNDPLDLVSGTLGLTGGCDGALILDRQRGMPGATLHLIGRDIEEDGAFAMRFHKENCHWELIGGAEEITASAERAHLLKVFKDENRGLSPKEVTELSERKASTVRRLLRAMVEAENLEQGSDRLYYLKGKAPKDGEQGEQVTQGEQGEQGEQSNEE
jgi:hypothetical protein